MAKVIVGKLPKGSREHRWSFFQAAGLRQVKLERGDDLLNLAALPPELWTILSCPTEGVHFDRRTLELLDSDGDGRIRVPELLAGVDWVSERLADPASILAEKDSVPLGAFSETEEGRALADLARRVLSDIDADEAGGITLADIVRRDEKLANTPFNGDGVITPETGDTPERRQLLKDILATCEGVADRCGEMGVRQEEIDAFFGAVQSYLEWSERGEAEAGTLLPLGEATAEASAAIAAVAAKIDDYFTRCRLAAFDARSTSPLNRDAADYAAFAATNLTKETDELAAFPLAPVEAGRELPLRDGLNPYWAVKMEAFAALAADPLLGGAPASLSEEQWQDIKGKIAPYDAWMAVRGGEQVAGLGLERLREIAKEGKAGLEELLERDRSFATEVGGLADLERLICYHTHLGRLLHNFVNFSDFYDLAREAIFRVGRLYVDGRVCNLCVDVKDVGNHATLAESGKIFLAYCELSRPATDEKKTICVAVTAGFAGTLWVGRNAVFYDREGRDWEAVIVRIVENQISLKEAFWAPWIKIAQMVSEQIKKMLSSRQ